MIIHRNRLCHEIENLIKYVTITCNSVSRLFQLFSYSLYAQLSILSTSLGPKSVLKSYILNAAHFDMIGFQYMDRDVGITFVM